MGSFLSRGSNDVQQIDSDAAPSYVYPPPSGNYFGSHFYMGGKKFDMIQPESYLFGDNTDLNMMGPKPVNFPYHVPNGVAPVRALKCLINIRKNSLRLIRLPNTSPKPEDVISTTSSENPSREVVQDKLYNIEFTFDSECPCSITIYYNTSEEMNNKAVVFTSKERSETIHYSAACNQQFCLTSHIVNPVKYYQANPKARWDFTSIPIAIHAVAECGDSYVGHSHIMYASFEKVSDDLWTIKPIKQKQAINGVCFLIQEIYGIENKTKQPGDENETEDGNDNDNVEDDNSECVVCLSDMRDTLILPCKHLCLCSSCANQLRFQQSGCPICRQSFRALLQIRAVRRKNSVSPTDGHYQSIPEVSSQEDSRSVDSAGESGEQSLPFEVSIPPGFEVIPLINAVNGPTGTNVRTPSVSSNLSLTPSILRSSRKKKNRTSCDVENELDNEAPSTSTSNLSSRKKKGRRKSRKEKQDHAEVAVEGTKADQTQSTENVYEEISETTCEAPVNPPVTEELKACPNQPSESPELAAGSIPNKVDVDEQDNENDKTSLHSDVVVHDNSQEKVEDETPPPETPAPTLEHPLHPEVDVEIQVSSRPESKEQSRSDTQI